MTFRNRSINHQINVNTNKPALKIGLNRQSIINPLSAVIQNENPRHFSSNESKFYNLK